MNSIIRKEFKLSASPLSFIFILFGLMFFLPGYPVLCGVFFVTLGIFQSFQSTRETNDILFSALLPVSKCTVVKAKFCFVCFIELCGFLLMAAATLIRMTVLSNSSVYSSNALMNANPFALGVALYIFALFNAIFVCGFFKTAYKIGPPFICYIVAAFFTLGMAEALHYIPGFEALNSFGFDNMALQLTLLIAGAALYAAITYISFRISCRRFEKIDL